MAAHFSNCHVKLSHHLNTQNAITKGMKYMKYMFET